MIPKMNPYRRDFDETEFMSFLMKNDELLEEHNEILGYLRTKIKSYEGKISTNSHGDKVPKEDSQCNCLSAILNDSVFRTGKNYYPQVFSEEC